MKYTVRSGVRSGSQRQGLLRLMRTALVVSVFVSCRTKDASQQSEKDHLLVSAAASLTTALTELVSDFERANTDVTIDLNFGGSSSLREQILNGAPVDVFASADENTMRDVISGLLQARKAEPADATALESFTIATNRMVIAVPHNNPAQIQGLVDFADADRFIGLCAEKVPCGAYARQVLASAGVTPSIDTNEPDVTSLATKIALGEIDAGIVYATDIATHAGRIDAIPIATMYNAIATYPMVIVKASSAASRFAQFVRSDSGRAIFTRHGFGAP